MSARGLDVVRVALLLVAIPSVYAEQTEDTGLSKSSASMEQRLGLSRPGIGAGPYRNGGSLRRLPDDPSPCGPKHTHLFVNRPCSGKTAGGDNNHNNNNDNDKGSGGPVVVLGGSTYHLDDDKGPSGDDSPNHGGNPPVLGDPKLPNHFDPTPEPAYMAVTGLAFAALWVLARKRRAA